MKMNVPASRVHTNYIIVAHATITLVNGQERKITHKTLYYKIHICLNSFFLKVTYIHTV